MLFFQIDNYNNPQHLTFKTKSDAVSYIREHPTCSGNYVQITEDTTDMSEKDFSCPHNGTYKIRITKPCKKDPSPVVRFDPVSPFSCSGKSFQDIFGTKTSSRGSIQNKILLSFWKTRFKRDSELEGKPSAIATGIRTMDDLFELILTQLNGHVPEDYKSNTGKYGRVNIKLGKTDYCFYTTRYESISGQRGASYCSDYRCMKLIDKEAGTDKRGNRKYVIVKASKVILDAIKTAKAIIGDAATTYVAEEFQRRYETEMSKLLGSLELHIDDHFDHIYSSKRCVSTFGSCMCDKGQHAFYSENMPASAAYLVDTSISGTKNIVARCIVFHNVTKIDEPGKKFNYAERQYASDELYKHILIAKLIDAGAIDIYKTIGAGCRDVNAILDVTGKRFGDTRLIIPAKRKLQRGDITSFQDTFIYYCPSTKSYSNFIISDKVVREMGHTNQTYGYDD